MSAGPIATYAVVFVTYNSKKFCNFCFSSHARGDEEEDGHAEGCREQVTALQKFYERSFTVVAEYAVVCM